MEYQARSALPFLLAALVWPGGALADSRPAMVLDSDAPSATAPFSIELGDERAGYDEGLEEATTDIGQSSRSRRARARARARARRRARVRARSRARRSATRERPARERPSRARRYEDDEDDYEPEPDRDSRRREAEERARESREERAARRRMERRYADPDVRPPPLVDIHVGARLEGRLASFETGDGNVHRNDVAYPSLGGMIRARPLNGETGLERGLEVRGSFYYAVGLRSRNTLTDEAVDTSFWHLYLDAAMFFEVDPAVQLGLGFGFGYDAFNFGVQSLVVVPSAEYPYLRPHLRGRFQIEDEMAVFELEGAYRGVLARGALSEHFGNEGETQGFDITARLGGSFDMGLSYNIEASVAGYFHFFQGDAVTAAGRSGTDLSLFLGAQVGYAFR